MIIEIIKDMIAFFMILSIATIAFAMMFCIDRTSNINFFESVIGVYQIDFGEFPDFAT